MMEKKLFFSAVIFASVALAFSCVSHPSFSSEQEAAAHQEALYVPQSFDWQPVCTGIATFSYESKLFPVRFHAVRIDLDTQGMELVCYPDKSLLKEPSGATKQRQPFVYTGIRTEQFAKRYGCIVAMNATPFGGRNGRWDFAAKIGSARQLVGVHRIDGLELAAPNERYSALAFEEVPKEGSTKQSRAQPVLRARVVERQTQESLAGYRTCFGGFFTVLKDGRKELFAVQTHDSRSGAGVSEDGRFLYLLAVEGEVPSRSVGLSYPQCADIFKAMGCTDALEFDGGSSTQLCVNGKSMLSYPFTVVEGNSFGFRFTK